MQRPISKPAHSFRLLQQWTGLFAWRSQRTDGNGRSSLPGGGAREGLNPPARPISLVQALGPACRARTVATVWMTAWRTRRCLSWRCVVSGRHHPFFMRAVLPPMDEWMYEHSPNRPSPGWGAPQRARLRPGAPQLETDLRGRPGTLHLCRLPANACRWRQRRAGAQSGLPSRLFSLHQAQHGVRAGARASGMSPPDPRRHGSSCNVVCGSPCCQSSSSPHPTGFSPGWACGSLPLTSRRPGQSNVEILVARSRRPPSMAAPAGGEVGHVRCKSVSTPLRSPVRRREGHEPSWTSRIDRPREPRRDGPAAGAVAYISWAAAASASVPAVRRMCADSAGMK